MERANGFERGRVEYFHNERVASDGSSTSRAEIGDVAASFDVRRRERERIRRMEHLDGEYSSYSRGVHNKYRGMHCDSNANRPEFVYFQDEDTLTSIISEGPVSSYRPARGASSQGRSDYFLYHDHGLSGHNMNSYYRQSERARYPNHDLDGPSRVEDLEKSRAELLWKLDELRDQLSRSCDVTENHAAYIQESSNSAHGVNKQPLASDDTAFLNLNQAPRFVPYSDRRGSSLRGSYPQRGYPREFLSYADTYQQEMFQRPPHQPQSQYTHGPHHEHFHANRGNVNHDLFVLHADESFFHQPVCYCCDKNLYLPPEVEPSRFYNQRSRNEPSNPGYHHHLYSTPHRPSGCSSGSSSFHTSHSRQSPTLNSTEPDSENDGINHNHHGKVAVAPRHRQVWRPVAGGAPFIACCNCFELLKLPRKHILLVKNQQKLKCGACSSIILFELRGSTVPVSGKVDHVSTDIDDNSSVKMDEKVEYNHGGSNFADTNACSNDYNDSWHKVSPADKKSDSVGSEKQLDPLPSALSLSEDEQTPETLASKKHDSPSAELHITEIESCPDPRLSSEDCPDHFSANIVISRFDKGNESKRSEFDQNTSRRNSVDDSAVATEIEMSLDEFSNSGVTLDSEDKSKEYQPMGSKGAESFFAGLNRKSSKDFTESTQNVEVARSPVFVNGHFIPDHLVKKAEKLAGPIQPGEYWYDIRAGFWGVMGQPCLGIIMPNIEEFNHPMPENCAAGNTEVFVNGRELHHKDLDLLGGRGLPQTRHGSYLVEISGKVVDEHTGEELQSLGKLAPTVERAKQGFGMKIPRFIARLQS